MADRTEGGRSARVIGLVPDPRRPGCVRVEVERPDGTALLTVPAEVIERLGVALNTPLPARSEDSLARAADEEAAFRTALRCLGRRPYAQRDLARRLVLRGHPPEAADAAVGKAAGLGLVDDEKFARHYIETRFARGRGPGRLRRELTALGVLSTLVDRLLVEAVPTELARDRMLALARKRAGQLAGLDRTQRLQRVLAYLARRGYRGVEVRTAVTRLVETPGG